MSQNVATGYLVLSAILFTVGMVGVLVRRNSLVILMCIELMLNAVNLTFLSFARYMPTLLPPDRLYGDRWMTGQMAVIFVMAVAAAEVAVGLGIIMAIFRLRDEVDLDDMRELNG